MLIWFKESISISLELVQDQLIENNVNISKYQLIIG